jgi:hypothetical protein
LYTLLLRFVYGSRNGDFADYHYRVMFISKKFDAL